MLAGKMAILWTGAEHDTPGFADDQRDYNKIEASGKLARLGVINEDIHQLAEGISLYHNMQLEEAMQPLPELAGSIAHKYCGGGHGGYALYLFKTKTQRDTAVEENDDLHPVEPYCI
jgi:mevalonate kinase